jgi:wyosine [tRNA(Phe)-imidazoG37] synthetase (radical SAM superfamily)
MTSVIYGPVSSWRLGSSLGVDLISTAGKTCSFDCIYCQLGKTIQPLIERRDFVSIERLTSDLEHFRDVKADYVTFSGMGEPTLASNLGRAIEVAKAALKLPVAVLTNCSLMPKEEVRRELLQANVVVAKLDAPNEGMFRTVNRPFVSYSLDAILQGIGLFRSEYRGRLALQMMFVRGNKGCAEEMARLATELSPDEVQINTPLRPCGVEPLLPTEIAAIRHEFSSLRRVITVYEETKPHVAPVNREETRHRRPEADY